MFALGTMGHFPAEGTDGLGIVAFLSRQFAEKLDFTSPIENRGKNGTLIVEA